MALVDILFLLSSRRKRQVVARPMQLVRHFQHVARQTQLFAQQTQLVARQTQLVARYTGFLILEDDTPPPLQLPPNIVVGA